jgi:hypothetical protein
MTAIGHALLAVLAATARADSPAPAGIGAETVDHRVPIRPEDPAEDCGQGRCCK